MKIKSLLYFLIGKSTPSQSANDYHPAITMLIPAFNEESTIRDTIKSIQTQNYQPAKIIVIDDCSTDKTFEIAKSMNIDVLRTSTNSGSKSKAQNYALMKTDLVNTELFITIDADTILDKDAIKNIYPVMSDPNVFSACGFVIPQVIKTFWEVARFGQYLYAIGFSKEALNHIGVPMVSSGCFSIFNTKSVKALGGFPEATIVEDMALTWNAYLNGYKIKLVPSARCYPKDPPTWNIYKGQVSRWYRGMLQCLTLYKTGILKHKRLTFFAYWYLISGALMPLLFAGSLIYAVYLNLTGQSVPFVVTAWVIFELGLPFVYIMGGGTKHEGLIKSFEAWLLYWATMPVEEYLFLKAIWDEWVLHDRLTVWNKGH